MNESRRVDIIKKVDVFKCLGWKVGGNWGWHENGWCTQIVERNGEVEEQLHYYNNIL